MKIRFGDCVLDTDERVLYRGGQQVHLTPKPFQLLAFLIEVRPRAVPKAELMETLWPATFVAEGNAATLVKESGSPSATMHASRCTYEPFTVTATRS